MKRHKVPLPSVESLLKIEALLDECPFCKKVPRLECTPKYAIGCSNPHCKVKPTTKQYLRLIYALKAWSWRDKCPSPPKQFEAFVKYVATAPELICHNNEWVRLLRDKAQRAWRAGHEA